MIYLVIYLLIGLYFMTIQYRCVISSINNPLPERMNNNPYDDRELLFTFLVWPIYALYLYHWFFWMEDFCHDEP